MLSDYLGQAFSKLCARTDKSEMLVFAVQECQTRRSTSSCHNLFHGICTAVMFDLGKYVTSAHFSLVTILDQLDSVMGLTVSAKGVFGQAGGISTCKQLKE